jgi:tetratricopeptide (TPR) repeat protein
MLTSNIIEDVKNRIKLARRFGLCLYQDGRYDEAEGQFTKVFETRKRVLGQEHPDTLTSMVNLASTYRNQGRWKEAEELQTRELDICSRVLGQEHPDTLSSMENLAWILKSQDRE